MGLNPFTYSDRGPKTIGALELEVHGDQFEFSICLGTVDSGRAAPSHGIPTNGYGSHPAALACKCKD